MARMAVRTVTRCHRITVISHGMANDHGGFGFSSGGSVILVQPGVIDDLSAALEHWRAITGSE